MLKKIVGYIILSQLVCIGLFLIYIGDCPTEASRIGFYSVWILCEIITVGIVIFLILLILALNWIDEY